MLLAEYSNYPNQIDTTTEIPKATDNVTPVKAELFNRLRDAIIAVENELGTQPSSIYSTVKARLDALESGLGIGTIIVPGSVVIKDHGTTIDNAASIDIVGNLNVISLGSGSVQIGNTSAKIRVYRSSSLLGNTATFPKTVIWDATSSLITSTNVSLISGDTELSIVKDGTYAVDGQLSIKPVSGVIGGITINVLKNNSIIHTTSDSGATWGVGIVRSFPFSLKVDLSSNDTISVAWIHSGTIDSATQLSTGDIYSWLSLVKLQ